MAAGTAVWCERCKTGGCPLREQRRMFPPSCLHRAVAAPELNVTVFAFLRNFIWREFLQTPRSGPCRASLPRHARDLGVAPRLASASRLHRDRAGGHGRAGAAFDLRRSVGVFRANARRPVSQGSGACHASVALSAASHGIFRAESAHTGRGPSWVSTGAGSSPA
jgi:hypothetical protein